MALYHTHRPQLFSSLAGQDHVRRTLQNALITNHLSHGYLFAGPRGSGKTTTARLLAKAVNCLELKDGELCNNHCINCKTIAGGKALDILEIDAASNRGIDEIRELRELVKFAPNQLKYKVIIIDEVHMLTKEAFNALLKTLEEPPTHVIFILATTEAHKVQATILSRVQRFDFKRADTETIIKNLTSISKAEKINLTPDGAELLASLAEGSFRDSVTLLDQVSSEGDKIDAPYIRSVLGLSDRELIHQFFDYLTTYNKEAALELIDTFFSQGGDPGNFLNQSLTEARLRLRTGDAKAIGWIKGLMKALDELKVTPLPSLPVELFIVEQIGLKPNEPSKPIDSISGEIEKAPTQPAPPPQPIAPVIKTIETVPVVEEIVSPPSAESIPQKKPGKPIDFTEENWHKLIKTMKDHNASLAAILQDSHLATAEDDTLTIAVKFKFHAAKITDRKNRLIIEEAIRKLTGQEVKVECLVDPGFVKFRETAEAPDLVGDAMALFEGA